MNVEKLKKLRECRGLLQKQIAIELGVTSECYCQWENGKRTPDPQMLVKLAAYFNVTVDYLLDAPQADKNVMDLSGLSADSRVYLQETMAMLKLRDNNKLFETADEFSSKRSEA